MTQHKILAAIFLLSLATSPALADPGGKHKSKGHHENAQVEDVQHHSKKTRYIDKDDRVVIRSYLHDQASANCPPGLAKKNNGCLPPGQAKKYQVGASLPSYATALPGNLVTRLGPPPAGTEYRMVGNDVVLVSTETNVIMDAVRLLSGIR